MRRTILLLGAMVMLLVVAGGVAFAALNYYYCSPNDFTCQCPNPANGVVCVGTNSPDQDNIIGSRNPAVGDTILARDGGDNVNGSEGNDRLYGERGDGDSVFGSWGNDYLSGGPGIKDVCEGGSGYDTRGSGCEKFIQ